LRGILVVIACCRFTQLHVARLPSLKQQEIPLDHPDSCNMFQPGPEKPFVATRGAIDKFQHETIIACLRILQQEAAKNDGIDYLQVFESPDGDRLWFIEDGEGGAITALIPEEY
jgi:hypothetical protein